MNINNLSKKQKIVILMVIVILIILLLMIISNNLKNSNLDNLEQIEYTRENTQIFRGNDTTSETTLEDNEVVSEEQPSEEGEVVLEEETEYQKYIDSGLVSEFVSIEFIYVDIKQTNIQTYYNKIMEYCNSKNSQALLANLDSEYVKLNSVTEDNVLNIFEKNGFTKDYSVSSLQFWGVNDSVLVITLKNDISGSVKYIGMNAKFGKDKQTFEIYTEEFFENYGFKIQDGSAIKLDDNKLHDAINNITENEYNSINI